MKYIAKHDPLDQRMIRSFDLCEKTDGGMPTRFKHMIRPLTEGIRQFCELFLDAPCPCYVYVTMYDCEESCT